MSQWEWRFFFFFSSSSSCRGDVCQRMWCWWMAADRRLSCPCPSIIGKKPHRWVADRPYCKPFKKIFFLLFLLQLWMTCTCTNWNVRRVFRVPFLSVCCCSFRVNTGEIHYGGRNCTVVDAVSVATPANVEFPRFLSAIKLLSMKMFTGSPWRSLSVLRVYKVFCLNTFLRHLCSACCLPVWTCLDIGHQ